MIDSLKPNQIFVFGANGNGNHGAGAAKFALEKGWTCSGHSRGLQMQSFAIDTMSGSEIFSRDLADLKDVAESRPELEFLLTAVGQGIAGYTRDEALALMPEMPSNVKKIGW